MTSSRTHAFTCDTNEYTNKASSWLSAQAASLSPRLTITLELKVEQPDESEATMHILCQRMQVMSAMDAAESSKHYVDMYLHHPNTFTCQHVNPSGSPHASPKTVTYPPLATPDIPVPPPSLFRPRPAVQRTGKYPVTAVSGGLHRLRGSDPD
ncbi:hypothetical protein OPT61_g10209 [Boeremia exigua]|uniref:Uncharacterized protein n=1 Tax=Boeremia exigua TaxID=749465 RepID=A0ACC2HRK2_9PLEO|nr:hypothetical protein OPT61_g10209 [Boeremia exigua]